MFDVIPDAVVTALNTAQIKAVRKYPETKLDSGEATVCVSLASVKLTASGLGNYIGLCIEDQMVKEMYGSRAELDISLCIYSPSADCDDIKNGIYKTLCGIESLTLRDFHTGDSVYDSKSGMFLCECTAAASALLVRELTPMGLSDYNLGEGDT